MINIPGWGVCTVAVVVATDGRREQNFTRCLKTDRSEQMEGERKGPTGMERCFREESVTFLFLSSYINFRSLFSLDLTFYEENVSGTVTICHTNGAG